MAESAAPLAPLTFRHWMAVLLIPVLLTGGFFFQAEIRDSPLFLTDYVPPYTEGARDDHAYTAQKAFGPAVASADIVLLGSSSAREALWEDDRLSQACGAKRENCRVVQLVTSAHSFLEALFLLRHARLSAGKRIVLSTSPLMFAYPPERSLWPIVRGLFFKNPLPFMKTYAEALPPLRPYLAFPRRQILFLRVLRSQFYRVFFVGLRGWFASHVYGDAILAYQKYRYTDPLFAEASRVERQRRRFQRVMERGFKKNREFHRRSLELLLEYLRSKQCEVVLMEAPVPRSKDVFRKWRAEYESVLQGIADPYGVSRVDLNAQAALEAADFVDNRHVSKTGRDKWSAAFVAWLVDSGIRT